MAVRHAAEGRGRGREGPRALEFALGLAWLRWAAVAWLWLTGSHERLFIRCLEILEVS